MFTDPESCECEGGQWAQQAKPDLAQQEQPPVVGGAAPDLPPSYTEVVTSRAGNVKEEDLPSYATICEKI